MKKVEVKIQKATCPEELENMFKIQDFGCIASSVASKVAERFERNLFEFMTEHKIKKVYVTIDHRLDSCYSGLELHREFPKEECNEYDFTNLLAMPNEEFEKTKHSKNYDTVKKWRDTILERI